VIEIVTIIGDLSSRDPVLFRALYRRLDSRKFERKLRLHGRGTQ
jgi:hypothetical protein